jgi:hypothetical protein
MGYLTRDGILEQKDLPVEDFEVPEWGGTLRLKTLTGAERDHFEASLVDQRGGKQKMNLQNMRARLVALCAVDEHGGRLFKADDVKLLGMKSARALDRVFERCQEMNGLSDKDVEDLTAGFPDDLSEGSISD